MAGIHTSRRAPINHISAIYRTGLLLASTLLHEFTHAFAMAYFEIPHTQDPDHVYEPWVRGNRANEQGWSFENYIFGGVVNPYTIGIPPMNPNFTGYLQSVAAPFGFYTHQQWDLWMQNNGYSGHVMDSDRKDDQDFPPERVFPVPQAWVHWLYSDDLWKDQVHRFGLSVVKVPKLQEWGVTFRCEGEIGAYRTGEDRWNTGQVRDFKPNWD
ncbi:unnamed protein product [Aureobasidium mustum]|uniref:Uncharacterized protein n=1 Tax=Aureobasidium mustum TaxID=2773714 RepID=A0A9N8PLJ8_9PEZI|nr:unnamed protein product [Aureobasidium mustum]